LVAALDGRFDDHHAERTRMLLDQIDALTTPIDTLTARIDQLLAAIPDAPPVDPRPAGPTPGQSIDTALGAVDRCQGT
jgi:transposase